MTSDSSPFCETMSFDNTGAGAGVGGVGGFGDDGGGTAAMTPKDCGNSRCGGKPLRGDEGGGVKTQCCSRPRHRCLRRPES